MRSARPKHSMPVTHACYLPTIYLPTISCARATNAGEAA